MLALSEYTIVEYLGGVSVPLHSYFVFYCLDTVLFVLTGAFLMDISVLSKPVFFTQSCNKKLDKCVISHAYEHICGINS